MPSTRAAIEPASVSRSHGASKRSEPTALADGADQPLGALGDDLPVRVRLVPLEHRELGVVLGREALVAEVLADLVDALQAAHDQALEVELGRDPQVHRAVERVEVGHERARQRAAVDRLQHRGLDLDEALVVEEAPDRGDDLGARDEDLAGLLVGHQVQLAVTQARLGVRQARGASPAADAATSPAASSRRPSTDSSPRRVLKIVPSTPSRSPRSSVTSASKRLVAEDVRARLQLDAARSGRRGRGTPPCPGRGARARRPATRTRTSVSSPGSSPSCGALASAIGVTPA